MFYFLHSITGSTGKGKKNCNWKMYAWKFKREQGRYKGK